MRHRLLLTALSFSAITIFSGTPSAKEPVIIGEKKNDRGGPNQPNLVLTPLESRHFLDEEGISLGDSTGKPVAKISNIELVLTIKKTTENELRPYYRIKYNFDNTLRNGKYGGTQYLYVDLMDSQGDLVNHLLKLDVSQTKCVNEAVIFEGFIDFDWRMINIQRMEFQAISPVDPANTC